MQRHNTIGRKIACMATLMLGLQGCVDTTARYPERYQGFEYAQPSYYPYATTYGYYGTYPVYHDTHRHYDWHYWHPHADRDEDRRLHADRRDWRDRRDRDGD